MIIVRMMSALLTPKHPRRYTGRHRAPGWLWPGIPRQRGASIDEFVRS